MANMIYARVMQKTATLSEWMSSDLVLLDGEQAFVVSGDGTPINFKIGDGTKTFSELPFWIQYDQAQYISVEGTSLPTPSQDAGYSLVGSGTFTQSGGSDIVVPSGNMGILSWDGDEWSLSQSVEMPMPELQKVEEWKPDFYPEDSITFHDNATWKAEENATSLDEPGVSNKWVKVSGGTASPLDVLDSTSTSDPLSANMGRVLDGKITGVRQGGVDNDSISLDKLTQEARDFIGSGGDISNNPDGEDLTAVDEGGVNVLKLKDRNYQPANNSGLGYKILRLGADNIITSSDFEANTVHEIRYDFNIDGGVLEMPENVTLKFNGGSLNNGEILGDNTRIDAGLDRIFDGVVFGGTFQVESVYPEWFGASSVKNINWSTAQNQFVDIHPSVMSLNDSSGAINAALVMSTLSGSNCEVSQGVYKIENTVNIPDNTTLYIGSNSALVAVMEGDGTDSGDNRILALDSNDYIPTNKMAVAVEMSPHSGRIEGFGYITLASSSYTIGIYIRGKNYMAGDMQFAPHIDVRTVGGRWGQTGADLDTLIGDSDPDSSQGAVGDTYLNRLTKRMFRKTSSTNWSFYKDADARFNTSVRVEVDSDDMRVINLDFNLWDMYGYRGIEFVQSNNGWGNQSFIKGTISNKISNFISFYNDKNTSLQGEWNRHDLSQMSYQIGATEMTKEARIIYADRLRFSQIGEAWDLWWLRSNLRSNLKYELSERSEGNIIPIDQNYEPFLKDLGTNNITIPTLDKLNPNNVGFSIYRNILEKRTPFNAGVTSNVRFQVFDTPVIPNVSNVGDVIRNNANRGALSLPKPPPQLFDCSGDTFYDFVDTSNDVFGGGFFLYPTGNESLGRSFNNLFLEVDYVISIDGEQNPKQVEGLGLTLFMGDSSMSPLGVHSNFTLRNTTSHDASVPGGTKYIPNKDYFKMPYSTSLRRLILYIGIDNEPDKDVTLRVYNIKLWHDNPDYYTSKGLIYGSTSNRPDACPQGHVYYDTTVNAPFINVGDSETQVWKKLLTEDDE